MSALKPIASLTANGAVSSITFSSIPTSVGGKAIKDLFISIDGAGAYEVRMYMNSYSSGSSYYTLRGYGYGTGNSYGWITGVNYIPVATPNDLPRRFTAQINLADFASTNKFKTLTSRSSDSVYGTFIIAGTMRYTDAITSLTLFTSHGGNFTAGSTFELYGIEG